MGTITVHEMHVDSNEKQIRVGKTIEIDSALITEIHSIRSLPLLQCLSNEEREKISKKTIGAYGSNIVVYSEKGDKCYNIIESMKYVQSLIKNL